MNKIKEFLYQIIIISASLFIKGNKGSHHLFKYELLFMLFQKNDK